MTYCIVKGCHNSSHIHKKDSKITFHAFPSDPIMAARWLDNVRRNRREEWWKPSKNTKICSAHFDDELKYTTKGGLCKLHKNAVPTKGLHITCEPENAQSDVDELLHHHSPIMPSTPEIHEDDSDMDSIFDTPRKHALRKRLEKKIRLEEKHRKKIKLLQQKVRRLQRRNLVLENKLKGIPNPKKKKEDVSDDVEVLIENPFSAESSSDSLFDPLSSRGSSNEMEGV